MTAALTSMTFWNKETKTVILPTCKVERQMYIGVLLFHCNFFLDECFLNAQKACEGQVICLSSVIMLL